MDEESKKVVQVLIASKLKENSYPVKNTEMEINVPEDAQKVTVHKRNTNATNGNREFNEENYQYLEEEGILKIDIRNDEVDGKINWVRNSNDVLVVTYEFAQDKDLKNVNINAYTKINTYDDKGYTAEGTVSLEEEIDGIVSTSVKANENEIYKGKIYTGEEKSFESLTQINIDYPEILKRIEVNEKKSAFVTEEKQGDANSLYVKTIINKGEMQEIFGEDGTITILD